MNGFLTTLVIVIGPAFLSGIGYFAVSASRGVKRGRTVYPEAKNNAYFAVLIAARNEEKVIEDLLESLENQDYPKDRYCVYVIPNNCTDATAEKAGNAGARILECNFSPKTKGEVLRHAFSSLKENDEIDAYVIFDADNVADADFLKEMNKAYSYGCEAAQCRRSGKNMDDGWVAECYDIFYRMQDIFNRARTAQGRNASISGTGWMVAKKVIDEDGFNVETMTEDIEFAALCGLGGRRIAFCESARTYDEYPYTLRRSLKQRVRWTYGQMECGRVYSRKLIRAWIKEGKRSCLDYALIFNGTHFQLSVPVFMAASVLKMNGAVRMAELFALLSCTAWAALSGVAALSIRSGGEPLRGKLRGVLVFPLFVISWLPVTVRCLFKKDCGWDRIEHDRSMSELRK